MTTEATLTLCREAIIHCLDAIASDPRKFWLMGYATGSRAKLLAAYAALTGQTEDDVHDAWLPDREAYQAYCEQKELDEHLLEKQREHPVEVFEDHLRTPSQWELAEWTERLLDALGGPDALSKMGFTEPERRAFLVALHPFGSTYA